METGADIEASIRSRAFPFPHPHLLAIAGLDRPHATALLDLADSFVALNRQADKKLGLLRGRTLVNLFFEASTRTQSSFELAGKRLGADVVNMSPRTSSMTKGRGPWSRRRGARCRSPATKCLRRSLRRGRGWRP